MTVDPDLAGLPVVRLRDRSDQQVALLRSLQLVILKHPVAAQQMFSALVAEGERFATTAEGNRWKRKLQGSELLHRARLVWEVATLWMLEKDPPGALPSTYLDAFFQAASSPDSEVLLDRLFRESMAGAEAGSPSEKADARARR